MSVDSRTQTIDASGQLRLANANFFFLLSSTANVTVVLNKGGSSETFAGVITGLRAQRIRKWDYAFITGAAGTVVTFFYGLTDVREDATDLLQQLATISGTVAVATLPSSVVTDAVDAVLASGAQTVIPANLARRRITIGCLSSSTNPLRISGAGGAGRGIEVSPGTYAEIDTTAALTVRNDNTFGGAGNLTWYSFEE